MKDLNNEYGFEFPEVDPLKTVVEGNELWLEDITTKGFFAQYIEGTGNRHVFEYGEKNVTKMLNGWFFEMQGHLGSSVPGNPGFRIVEGAWNTTDEIKIYYYDAQGERSYYGEFDVDYDGDVESKKAAERFLNKIKDIAYKHQKAGENLL